ncbi:MAG: NAD-dependent epimerase/dehydratase family protein [Deltaproteobacteria bacterium]|nr:NAD-dependent epimerase/dehydratase family protein [Deltaproteobacteria bacterium]
MDKQPVSKKTRKVLITGANGFVGSNLTKFLSRNPFLDVYAMVRPGSPVNFLYEFQRDRESGRNMFELVEANLKDEMSIADAVNGMDVVVHLAGLVGDWGKKSDFVEANVEGTRRLLDCASKAKVSRVIFLSSLTVHAMDGHDYSDENAPRDMADLAYGETKKIGEDLVLDWASGFPERKSTVVRPGWVIYGSYDKNTFIEVLDHIKKGSFGFIDKGKSLISYVYVENLCYGIEKLIMAPEINGVYNILDGNMRWREWIMIWADALKVRSPRLSVPYWFMFPFVFLIEVFFKFFRIKNAPLLTLYRIRIMHKDLAFKNDRIVNEHDYSSVVSLGDSVESTLGFYHGLRK